MQLYDVRFHTAKVYNLEWPLVKYLLSISTTDCPPHYIVQMVGIDYIGAAQHFL